MAYFRCGQGGGNELKIVITTADSSLYGQTITISKNGSTVGTTVFDNTGNAEYTVDEAGTYDVTCGGASDSVLVEDEFEVSLTTIPDGSTITPVNDIQTWLKCAGIFNKTSYTTLADVLADTTTLLALISSNNAVDYMVRSHAWCSDVCANSTAMTYIGANNYASDTLLADSGTGNWLESICNSTYFESVLNVKVPTMTSNTTPSGEVIYSTVYDSNFQAYQAFNGSIVPNDYGWIGGASDNAPYVGYIPTSAYKAYRFDTYCMFRTFTNANSLTLTYQGYNGSQWKTIGSYAFSGINTSSSDETPRHIIKAFANGTAYKRYRVLLNYSMRPQSLNYFKIVELQFYGRKDV